MQIEQDRIIMTKDYELSRESAREYCNFTDISHLFKDWLSHCSSCSKYWWQQLKRSVKLHSVDNCSFCSKHYVIDSNNSQSWMMPLWTLQTYIIKAWSMSLLKQLSLLQQISVCSSLIADRLTSGRQSLYYRLSVYQILNTSSSEAITFHVSYEYKIVTDTAFTSVHQFGFNH